MSDHDLALDVQEAILSPKAKHFLDALANTFEEKRQALLQKRQRRQAGFNKGDTPDFLPESASIRDDLSWKTHATIPHDLTKRLVEITGPVQRKMVINALNSGADVFMADFEDSNSPTWENCLQGQQNLIDAVQKTITHVDEVSGKSYHLHTQTATLVVRPRGWHLDEAHYCPNKASFSASLFDFGLYLFHNADALLEQGSGPYFYLPKLESAEEAALWAEVFAFSERSLELPKGSIKATVLIETITAAFEMHEIIYALRDYIVGLNSGRWDYIFSYIKKLQNHPDCILPDRNSVTMRSPFLHCYSDLLVKTCHQRGIYAIGGMAAQIPIKDDPIANGIAMDKVFQDKDAQVRSGYDGTWVAHPGLVELARKAFRAHMQGHAQLARIPDVKVNAEALLQAPEGLITEDGVRRNIQVGIRYTAAWLSGNGCVPIFHLMEDAATAEICRAQLWQWQHYAVKLSDGRVFDGALFERFVEEEVLKIRADKSAHFDTRELMLAETLFIGMTLENPCAEFLTLPAYHYLVQELKQ